MKILLCGINGRIGTEILRLIQNGKYDCSVAAGIDIDCRDINGVPCVSSFDDLQVKTDVILDFSHPSLTPRLLEYAAENTLPLVLATTGHTPETKNEIKKVSEKIPLFYTANCSIGITLLTEFAKTATSILSDAEIEITEIHHDQKIDAPSGTALAIAEALREVRTNADIVCGRSGFGRRSRDEIGVHSIRIGCTPGTHEIMLGTPTQTILLKHEVHSPALFAEGALAAVRFIRGKPPGLYTMKDLLTI